jgi:hypothetical protein
MIRLYGKHSIIRASPVKNHIFYSRKETEEKISYCKTKNILQKLDQKWYYSDKNIHLIDCNILF